MMLEARLVAAAESLFRPIILLVARLLRAPAAPWWVVLVVAGLLLRVRKHPLRHPHAVARAPSLHAHQPPPPPPFSPSVPTTNGTWQWRFVPTANDQVHPMYSWPTAYTQQPAAPLLLTLAHDDTARSARASRHARL
mmetsp:Transcript_22152/g.67228  ORF Transcript_22152/g.67228 Transcript_22152/m.67228 type:complete len:137 (-) Transcript_22152:274-684(-)|eukprot:scaffold49423_cov22-Tisochrysis_lutea.AAC.1